MKVPSLPWPEGIKDDIQLVSFDVFDTLIFRYIGSPDEFFFHLAVEAKKRNLWLIDDYQSFVKLRRRAEDTARFARYKKSGHREVTLDEIYNHWPSSEAAKICCLESELEFSGWMINRVAFSWLEQVYAEGKKLALVSDMYIDSRLILSFIEKQNSSITFDHVFVSGEMGASKQDGSLFTRLISSSGIEGKKILHIGDNFVTDHQMAIASGIRSLVITPPEYFFSLNNYEQRLGESIVGLNALRRHWLWHYPDESLVVHIGALIYGPVLFHLVHWLKSRCKALEIDTIFCLLREGEAISSLLSIISDSSLKIKTIHISRRSSFLPALGEITPNVLYRLSERRGYTLAECVEDLGFNLTKKWQTAASTCLSALVGTEIWDELLEEVNNNKDLINDHLNSQRNLLQRYLADIGVENRTGVGFWDWGCGASMFTSLSSLITLDNARFFMAFASDKSEAFSLIHHLEIFMPRDERAKTFCKSPELSEVLLNGTLSSTRSYFLSGEAIKPQFVKPNVLTPSQALILKDFRRGVDTFVAFANASGFVPSIDFKTRKAVTSLLYRLVRYPLTMEALSLGQLQVPLSCGITNKLITDDSITELRKNYLRADEAFADLNLGRLNLYGPSFWSEGAIAQAFPGCTGLLGELGLFAGDDIVVPLILENLKRNNIKTTAIYGAGELGKKLYELLTTEKINVSAVIDQRAAIVNLELYGEKVVTIEEYIATGGLVFSIASRAFFKEIADILKNKNIKNMVIVSYLGLEFT